MSVEIIKILLFICKIYKESTYSSEAAIELSVTYRNATVTSISRNISLSVKFEQRF